MNIRIAISGTPGTGKTSVSRRLAESLGYEYIDLNIHAREAGLVDERDEDRDADVVDETRLPEMELPEDAVVDGHLSHYTNSDIYVILRTQPDALEKRLEEKGWDRGKVEENLEAEKVGVCAIEAREYGSNVLDVDTTGRSAEDIAALIESLVRKGDFDETPIDWTSRDYEAWEERRKGTGAP